jgi:Amt family ammonium transporter
MIDFAGSTVVHVTGGMTALIATKILGPRTGRFYDVRGRPLESPKEFPGHSLALQMLGVFILWFGWLGFNTGSIINLTHDQGYTFVSRVSINTILAGASGTIMTLFLHTVVQERLTGEVTYNLQYAMNGCLAGLVSVTGDLLLGSMCITIYSIHATNSHSMIYSHLYKAGCAVIETWASIIVGLVGGGLYLVCSQRLVKCRIDDAVGEFVKRCLSSRNLLNTHWILNLIFRCYTSSLSGWNLGYFECRAVCRARLAGDGAWSWEK